MTPEDVERLRRSIAMLRPGSATAVDRERALELLEELQRLDHLSRRYEEAIGQLRTILATLEGPV
jgi:hypothetical protein